LAFGRCARGILADVLDDLGMNRQDFYFKKVRKGKARQAVDQPEES